MLLLGCDRWEQRYLNRPLTPADIAGEWLMTKASLQDLRLIGQVDVDPAVHIMTFREDGTCHFSTFPTVLTSQGRPNARVDCECKWTLRQSRHQTLSIDLLTSPELHTHFYFTEDAQRNVVIWRNATDPDHELYVEYVRKQAVK
jgi:hypothetical protein